MKNKFILWGGVVVVVLMFFNLFGLTPGNKGFNDRGTYVTYSDFVKKINNKEVLLVRTDAAGQNAHAVLKDGKTRFYTRTIVGDDAMLKAAQANQVAIDVESGGGSNAWVFQILIMLLPVGALIAYLHWSNKKKMSEITRMTRPDGKGGKFAMMVDPKDNPHRLVDVAGCDEAKQEVSEIVEFLRNPETYSRVGARAPKGVLMSGPPGTGKTLMAKAIAGEAGVPFFSVNGSEFMEMFVGLGAARVRELFDTAKQHAPSIIFIDEIDSIGRSRSSHNMTGNDERDQTLNQLLGEMDGFTPSSSVVVIAATNRTDILDKALLRPGRFDREVGVDLPDRAGREDILKVHSKRVPLGLDVVLKDIAKGTPGFSGADLSNLVNEAAVLAAREKSSLVTKRHFMQARDKVIMGVQRSPLKNEQERITVAYHEAGHAVVAHFTEGSSPVHKISIVPRGRALGVTIQLPEDESYNHTQKRLIGDIAILMGGRAAEDVVLQQRTVGASNDFMRATVMARRIIASWGMDPEFGPMSIDGERGDEYAHTNVWSEKLKQDADDRVRKILQDQYNYATQLLRDNMDALQAVANGLLEKEDLDGEEFEAIITEVLAARSPTSTLDSSSEEVSTSEVAQTPVASQDLSDATLGETHDTPLPVKV